MGAPDLVHLASLIDDAKCFALVRQQGKRTRSATQGGAQVRGRIPAAIGESRASLPTSDA